VDRCLPSRQLRTFFNQEGAPTDDQVARFVEVEMNGCTEIVAAQAQVREWARQAHAKRHKAEKKAQAALQNQSDQPQQQNRQQQSGGVLAAVAGGAMEHITVGGICYPLECSGPKPAGCKNKKPCTQCNSWGHTKSMPSCPFKSGARNSRGIADSMLQRNVELDPNVANTAAVVAFIGGGGESFWLGAKVGAVGSSRGERIEVQWYEKVGGVYQLEAAALDLMEPRDVVMEEVLLEKVADGKFALSAQDEEAITSKIASMEPRNADDNLLCALCGEDESADPDDDGIICDG